MMRQTDSQYHFKKQTQPHSVEVSSRDFKEIKRIQTKKKTLIEMAYKFSSH